MYRGLIVIVVAGLASISLGLVSLVSPTTAQEGTPAAETEIAPGIMFDLIPASEDPPSLYRLRLAPGATLAFAGDPAISLVYVASGRLELQLDTSVSDTRSNEATGQAETSTVRQGDYFLLPPLVAGEIRNERREPASIVIAAITPAQFLETAAGTPVPE